MNYTSVKSAADVNFFDGIKIEFTKNDKMISEIIITDKADPTKMIRIAAQYGTNVYIPSKPEMKKKFKVTGTVLDFAIKEEFFDSKYDAENAIDEMVSSRFSNLTSSDLNLKVVETEVPDEEI